MAANTKKKQNVELLTISDQNELNYWGYCKIMINTLSKQIFVEPYDESIKMIQASFDWIFMNDENILFAKSIDSKIQFALVFKAPATTIKIMNVIGKYHPQKTSNQKVLFVDDIFVPAVLENRDTKIREIFLKYVKFCHGKKKEKYLKIMGNTNHVVRKNLSKTTNNRHHNLHKRSFHNSDESFDKNPDKATKKNFWPGKRLKLKPQKEQTKTVNKYSFKLIKYKELDEEKEKLFIFIEEIQNFGHSYKWDNLTKKFRCSSCRYKEYISIAILKKDEKGKEYYEVGIHSCHPQKFNINYDRRRKIYKPDYKIVDGYIRGKLKQRLIVFEPTNKELCYEYYPKGKKFCCAGCMTIADRRLAAKIFCYGTEKEYIEIYSDDHVCELRSYNPQKFVAEQKIIKKPGFKFEKEFWKGRERERLIIFDSSNKEFYYKYAKDSSSYVCLGCKKQRRHRVTAVLVKNVNEEEYIRLSPNPHICEPQLYANYESCKEIIIENSKFKIFKQNKSTVIFVMDKENEILGYKYLRLTKGSCFYCVGCYQKTDEKENLVKLKCNENDEKYLTADANQIHSCKPTKFYGTSEEANIINPENFVFVEIAHNQNATSKQLIVFTSDDRTLCYIYLYITSHELFKCKACLDKKKNSSAKICKNLDGKEYVKLGVVKHVCKPKKCSTLKSSIKKFLTYDDFPKNEKPRNRKPKEKSAIKDDSKIVKLPNFKLLSNKNGIKDSLLIIPDQNDNTLFYQYNYHQPSDIYVCVNCRKAKHLYVSAKLCKDNTGIQYITLGINEHICEPMKIIEKEKFNNYLIFDRNNETKQTKLVVFTSSERTECYEYFQGKGRIKFYCCRCIRQNISRFAEVVKDEDGNEYIELDERKHVCEPILFELSKYEKNPTIPQSQFLLFPNSHGAPNKKLIIFDSNNYNFGYDCNKNDSFVCCKCQSAKEGRYFTTKLSTTKNGEDCLEILQKEHVCEAKNLFQEKRIFYSSNYKIINDGNGNQVIVVNHPTNKTLCYKFAYDNDLEVFCCIQCRKDRNKTIAAKICKTNTKEEILVLAFNHHCEPFRQ